MPPWICSQIGAREHYSIPQTLHAHQSLQCLLTDAWVSPKSPLHKIQHRSLRSLQDRFNPGLSNASIESFTYQSLLFEAQKRLQRHEAWQHTIARNTWFQKLACHSLKKISQTSLSENPILFTYSYAALEQLKLAKEQGWPTILGQIDPGIMETNLVRAEHHRNPDLAPALAEPPDTYWKNWETECQLADHILINSNWSKQALESIGVPATKLHVVPLAYQTRPEHQQFQRVYPTQFNRDRPLRVLFLGQIILRKGLAAIIEAAKQLRDHPIKFLMVGPIGIDPPHLSNLHWKGSVPRSQVSHIYQQADVFLFPTLSDGFGLTQLEAQAWKLPIIASQHCGEVVKDHVNGYILSEVSGNAIASTLITCLKYPEQLNKYSLASTLNEKYSLDSLYHNLQQIIHAPI